MRNEKTVKLVEAILKRGFKKADIKRFCGVEWQTVHTWHLGYNAPENPETKKKLKQLLKMKPADLKACA